MGRIKNFIRNINYLTKHSLWDQREDDIAYLTDKILDDSSYEYNITYPRQKILKILTAEETMQEIISSGKSFIRTGDGEISLMMGKNHSFQDYNEEIAERLLKMLHNPPDNILVGLNRVYFVSLGQKKNRNYYRRNAYDFRKFYLENCSSEATYIDATCTGPFFFSDSKDMLVNHYEEWKKMFRNRDIVVVCGEGLLDEYEYDVFEYANCKGIINCPRTNAWKKKDEIVQKIHNYSTDILLVFILGQAGKAMIYELVEEGYVCWDVGHLAKYYNALMKGISWNNASFYAPD